MSFGSSSSAALCARFFSTVRLRLASTTSDVQAVTTSQSRYFTCNIQRPKTHTDVGHSSIQKPSISTFSTVRPLICNNTTLSAANLHILYRDAVRRFSTSRTLPARESALTRRRTPARRTSYGEPYSPPPPSPPPSRPSPLPLSGQHFSQWLLWTLMGLNAIVFCGWAYGQECLKKYKDPRVLFFMSDNFLSGIQNLREGRYWTIVTSSISHSSMTDRKSVV